MVASHLNVPTEGRAIKVMRVIKCRRDQHVAALLYRVTACMLGMSSVRECVCAHIRVCNALTIQV